MQGAQEAMAVQGAQEIMAGGLSWPWPRSSLYSRNLTTLLLPVDWKEVIGNENCLKSSVKFPQSVMILAAMSYAGVGPLCFLKSTVNAAICQEILLTSFMEMLISFSTRTWHLPTLPKVPKAGSMTMVLLCLIGQQTRLT